jgi:hypothetical protein
MSSNPSSTKRKKKKNHQKGLSVWGSNLSTSKKKKKKKFSSSHIKKADPRTINLVIQFIQPKMYPKTLSFQCVKNVQILMRYFTLFVFLVWCLFFIYLFWDNISLCSPGWPQTCNPQTWNSVSWVLGLQACTTMPGSGVWFYIYCTSWFILLLFFFVFCFLRQGLYSQPSIALNSWSS